MPKEDGEAQYVAPPSTPPCPVVATSVSVLLHRYRPFEAFDELVEKVERLSVSGDKSFCSAHSGARISFAALPRAGPFMRWDGDLSAERAVMLTSHNQGKIFVIDTRNAAEGSTWRLHLFDDAAAAAEEEEEEETDIVYIIYGHSILCSELPIGEIAAHYDSVRSCTETAWHEQARAPLRRNRPRAVLLTFFASPPAPSAHPPSSSSSSLAGVARQYQRPDAQGAQVLGVWLLDDAGRRRAAGVAHGREPQALPPQGVGHAGGL